MFFTLHFCSFYSIWKLTISFHGPLNVVKIPDVLRLWTCTHQSLCLLDLGQIGPQIQFSFILFTIVSARIGYIVKYNWDICYLPPPPVINCKWSIWTGETNKSWLIQMESSDYLPLLLNRKIIPAKTLTKKNKWTCTSTTHELWLYIMIEPCSVHNSKYLFQHYWCDLHHLKFMMHQTK